MAQRFTIIEVENRKGDWMKKFIVVGMLLLTVLLSGCAQDAMEEELSDEEFIDENSGWELSDEGIPTYDSEFEVDEEHGGDVLASNDTPALETRKIIYTANLSMVATDPEAIYQDIVSKLPTYDAYFEAENINAERYTITIRVLSANLMDFVNDIKGQGEVIVYSKSSQDVTNEYSRFEAEYTAKQTEYDRIFELLEAATELSDIYSLSNKLADLEADLNEIGLHLTTYDSLVDYSTINLTITKIENLESLMETSTKPGLTFENSDETSISIIVSNHSENSSTFYIVVKQNGEEITTLTKELVSEAKEELLFENLDPDTEYKFEVYSTEDNRLTSNPQTMTITTDATYGSTLSNVFTSSVDSLVTLFQWLLIIVLALVPYLVVFSAVFVPGFIIYKKTRKTV